MNNVTSQYIYCDILGINVTPHETFYWCLFSSLLLQSVLTIIFNFMYLAVMFKCVATRTISECLYIMLSVSDVLTAVIVTPAWMLTIYQSTEFYMDCKVALYINFTGYSLVLISVSTILLITIEMYIAVMHPFYYEGTSLKKKFMVALALLWVLCIVFSVISSVIFRTFWDMFQKLAGLIFLLVILLLFFAHHKVYREVKRICSRIIETDRDGKRRIQMKSRSVKLSLSISLTLTICFTPTIYYSFHVALLGKTTFTQSVMLPVFQFIALLNGLFNPFVYYFRLTKIRRKVRGMFSLSSVTRRTEPSTVS